MASGTSPIRSFAADLFRGRRYAVLGLGRNGAPAVRTLAALGAEVQAWDDGEAGRNALADLPQGVTLAPFTEMSGFDGLVLSPGIPHRLPRPHPVAVLALEAGVPILSDAELLFQAVRMSGSRARFAGVTGTNGKSTTTTLLAHLLRHAGIPVAEGGNLGPAALALPLLPDDGVYVLEMSSYMLERLDTLHFDTACLLNLTPDHIDRHGDMAGYAAAKTQIFKGFGPGDLAVLGTGHDMIADLADKLRQSGGTVTTISGVDINADIHMQDDWISDSHGRIAQPGPALPGAHNAENAAAASAMATYLGVPRDALPEGLASFPGLAHRQKLVAEIDGISFIDDSKATNADAAARALGCHDRLIWIAGGMAKEGGIEDLVPFFPRIAKAFLIGRDAPILAETLKSHGVTFEISNTLERAVPNSYNAAQELGAKVVLLSPACASFDQFSSFEARGLRFITLSNALMKNKSESGNTH